jgi:hypothetical protein
VEVVLEIIVNQWYAMKGHVQIPMQIGEAGDFGLAATPYAEMDFEKEWESVMVLGNALEKNLKESHALFDNVSKKKLIFHSSQKNFKVIILNKKNFSQRLLKRAIKKYFFVCAYLYSFFVLCWISRQISLSFETIYCTFCLNIYVSFLPKIFLYFQIKLRFLIGVNKIDFDYYLLFFIFFVAEYILLPETLF